MDNDSFYIQLVSNSKSFKDNTVSRFKNRIGLDRELDGNWEIAVVEISYTYSWKNVIDGQWIALATKPENPNIPYVSTELKYIKDGHYDNINQLIQEIQYNMQNYHILQKEVPSMMYDDITKYIYIEPGIDSKNRLIIPEFSEQLAGVLGFDNYSAENRVFVNDKIVSDRPPDLQAGLRTLFIYSEHIVPQYIGDGRSSLLKTVEVPTDVKFGDQVVIRYNNPHYIPLLYNDFEIMEIDMRDAAGDPVQFLFGFTMIKLHLRKKNV